MWCIILPNMPPMLLYLAVLLPDPVQELPDLGCSSAARLWEIQDGLGWQNRSSPSTGGPLVSPDVSGTREVSLGAEDRGVCPTPMPWMSCGPWLQRALWACLSRHIPAPVTSPSSQTHRPTSLHFHPVLQLLVSHAIVSICCLTLLSSVAKSIAVPCLGWLWCSREALSKMRAVTFTAVRCSAGVLVPGAST